MKVKIRKAKKNDFESSLQIAKSLPKWFTPDAIKNMEKDFVKHNLLVALEKEKVIGFLGFSIKKNYSQLIWLAIKKEYQKRGIGSKLLKKLIDITKKHKKQKIRVETLSDLEKYKPYDLTRAFYYKNGFKKVAVKQPIKPGWDIQDVLERRLG